MKTLLLFGIGLLIWTGINLTTYFTLINTFKSNQQTSDTQQNQQYINVFINEEKNIYTTMNTLLHSQKEFIEFIGDLPLTLETYASIMNSRGFVIGNYFQNIRYSPLVQADQLADFIQRGKQLIDPAFTVYPLHTSTNCYIPIFYASPTQSFPKSRYGFDLNGFEPIKTAFFDKFQSLTFLNSNHSNSNVSNTYDVLVSNPIKFAASLSDMDLGIYIGNLAYSNTSILGINYIAILLRDYINAVIANTYSKVSNIHVDFIVYFNHSIVAQSTTDFHNLDSITSTPTSILYLFDEYTLHLFIQTTSNIYLQYQTLLRIILPSTYFFITIYLCTIYYYTRSLLLFKTQKIKEINNMVTYVNHELRNPLNIVYGMSQIIQLKTKHEIEIMQKTDHFFEELYSNISTVINSVRSITLIVNDVLDMQKLEENRLEINIQRYTWKELMYDFKKSVIHKLYESHHNVTTIIEEEWDESCCFYTDKNRLLQILVNLYTNAVKYTNEGSIIVKKQYESNYIKISIIDTGTGISAQIQTKIFKEIIMKTTNNFNSSGMGLYICKMLANKLKYKLYFTSSPQGTTFVLEIPTQPINTNTNTNIV